MTVLLPLTGVEPAIFFDQLRILTNLKTIKVLQLLIQAVQTALQLIVDLNPYLAFNIYNEEKPYFSRNII